jgi:hypothetical protein
LPRGISEPDFSLVGQRLITAQKGEKIMKTLKAALAILFLAGNMGFTKGSAAGVSGVISKDALAAGDYCHMKFAAIREETLGSSHPVLKEANEGDIVDFYGPCSHDPLGKEEVQAQLLQLQHRRARDYMD